MKLRTLAFVMALAAGSGAWAKETARLEDLAWLAGTWRGTLSNGAQFEAYYTTPDGGLIVSVSKEVRNGRAVAFEFERFHEGNGSVVYHPHPNGKPSEHTFPLVEFDKSARRASFENTEHDFPQRFVFDASERDVLVITLSAARKDNSRREIVFRLQRVTTSTAK